MLRNIDDPEDYAIGATARDRHLAHLTPEQETMP
jgi:hypothetical protein